MSETTTTAPAPVGLLVLKLGVPELDGTYTSIEVSVPADADDDELTRRLDLAEKVQGMMRDRFYWAGRDIDPANHLIPFGRNRGQTIKQVLDTTPQDLEWYAYTATGGSPAFKLACQIAYERYQAGQYSSGEGATYNDGGSYQLPV